MLAPERMKAGRFLDLHKSKKTITKNLLIFKTNLDTSEKVKALVRLFKKHPFVASWSVDIEDVDNVLRVETTGAVNEKDVIDLMHKFGIYCELLND